MVGMSSSSAWERRTDGTLVVPSDGDIRAALEEARGDAAVGELSGPQQTVRLASGTTYDIAEPVTVPPGVTLEFNGAKLEVTADVDGIRAGGATTLRHPIVEAVADAYDSTLLRVTDTIEGGVQSRPRHPCTITEMRLGAPYGAGTGYRIEDRNGSGTWGVQASGIIVGTDTCIHYDAAGEGSWINGCWFEGILGYSRVGVRTEAGPEANPHHADGHRFNIMYQPSSDPKTEWFWDQRHGTINRMLATVWDNQHIEDRTIWRIGPEVGDHNVLIDAFNGVFTWADNVVCHRDDRAGNTVFTYTEAMGGDPR